MTTQTIESEALATQPSGTLIPSVNGEQFAESFRTYQALQAAIDAAMPSEIVLIKNTPYRKKGYWKALRAAFNLTVECVHDERVEVTMPDGAIDWGWNVRYRASAQNGSFVDGDGSCFATEKVSSFSPNATEHNVRAHAHTRASNRAISSLVGFGEVSYAEMETNEDGGQHKPRAARVAKPRTVQAAEPIVARNDPPPLTDIDLEDPGVSHSFDYNTSETESSDDADELGDKFDDGKLYVSSVAKSSGERNGRSWTRYFIRFSDGSEGSTFDSPIGSLAEDALNNSLAVNAIVAPSKRNPEYSDVTGLTVDGSA